MVIVTDSAIQLDYPTIEELGIEVVEYPLFVNGEPYPVSMRMSREEKDLVRGLIKDKRNQVSTSGLREEDLREVFRRHAGGKILMMHQSARMSSLTATVLNKVTAEPADPDIVLFDTHHMVAAHTTQVLQAARAVRDGVGFEELMPMLERNRANTRHLGAVYDLFFLQRTGRIGRAKAIMGHLMRIIPLLGSSQEAGVLENIGKVKTSAQANRMFLGFMEEDMKAKGGSRVTAVTPS